MADSLVKFKKNHFPLLPCTPLKTNMSLENQWLEDVFPTESPLKRGRIRSFSGGVCSHRSHLSHEKNPPTFHSTG